MTSEDCSLTQLPAKWAKTIIGNVAELVTKGSSPNWQGFDYVPQGIMFVRSQNVGWGELDLEEVAFLPEAFNQKEKKSILKKGDVLLNIVGASIGRAALSTVKTEGGNVNQAVAVIRLVEDGLWSHYLVKYLLSPEAQAQIHSEKVDVARANISLDDIKNFYVPVPPLTEQRRIVAKIEELFTKLDAGVAALKTAQAQLKRYRQAVLKAAVEGELTREWREQHKDELEPASVLLERILRERRAKWEADQLAKMHAQGKPPKDDKWKEKYQEPATAETHLLHNLPLSWAMATVEQLSDLVQYGSSAKTNEEQSGIPVLRMGNIIDGNLNLEKLKYLPSNHVEFPDLLLKKGDVLFNRTNSAELVGKTAVYNGVPAPCSFASYLIRLRLSKDYSPKLLAYYLNSLFGKSWIASVVSQQVGQANVNGTKLQALSIPLAPYAEQEQIVAEVERRLSIADGIEAMLTAELKRAERLRQAILKRAFEGKLVPQDPNDEPAAVLLERIRQTRATQAATTSTNGNRPTRKRKTSTTKEPTLPME